VVSLIFIVGLGWYSHDYLSRYHTRMEARAEYAQIALDMTEQKARVDRAEAQLIRLYDIQIESLVARIARLRAKEHKNADEIDLLRYWDAELDRLKKMKEHIR